MYVAFDRLVGRLEPVFDRALMPPPPRPPNRRRRPLLGCSFRCLNRSFGRRLVDRLPLGLDRVRCLARGLLGRRRRRRRSRRREPPSTPGSPSASFVSSEASFALNAGGRSTLPNSIPGPPHVGGVLVCLPVTKSRPSTFGTDVPATFHLWPASSAATARDRLHQLLALGQFAEAERRLPSGPTTLPSATVSDRAIRPCACSAARSSSASRAAAAARRNCAAMSGVVRLPKVPPSNGHDSRVGHHQLDPLDRGVQFLGDDLRERGADVLADLDLAGVDGDRAVLADVQPGADLLRPALAAATARLLSAESSETSSATTRPPPAMRKNSRRSTSQSDVVQLVALGLDQEIVEEESVHRLAPFHRLGGFLDRGDDPRVGAAAADVAVHPRDDSRAFGVRVLIQESDGRHDHARRAVAALHRAAVEEGLLNWMQPIPVDEPLDRADLLAGDALDSRVMHDRVL